MEANCERVNLKDASELEIDSIDILKMTKISFLFDSFFVHPALRMILPFRMTDSFEIPNLHPRGNHRIT
jgi:hypothetical protein